MRKQKWASLLVLAGMILASVPALAVQNQITSAGDTAVTGKIVAMSRYAIGSGNTP